MDTRRASLLLLSFLSTYVQAYSFKFDNTPSQCGNVSISITGSGGKAPYRLGIVPWGSSPLPGQLEVREILDLQFNDSSCISFTLPYPKNSSFLAIVSDNNGTDSNFASGGITAPVFVTQNTSDSCLPTNTSHPPFVFSMYPSGSITTCQSSNLTWDGNTVVGDVKFWGAIPGGNGFIITGESVQDQGQQGITWTPHIYKGTSLVIIAGDDRGFGSGGIFQGRSQPGNGTTSCLNSNYPKNTPGSLAGGSYPTDPTWHRPGGSNVGVGAIVGGVIGGASAVIVAAIIGLVVFFLLRRRSSKRPIVGELINLLEGREGDNEDNRYILQHYLPEPFHIPPSTPSAPTEMSETTTGLHPFSARVGRLSQLFVTTPTRIRSDETSTAPGQSTVTSAKSPTVSPPLRPVNIIQHEDAGPSEAPRNKEEETVELPPAYTNIPK